MAAFVFGLGRPAYFRGPSSTTRETHLSATCRRRSRSPGCALATRIARLPMRFRVRSTSRCSRWSASASRPPSPSDCLAGCDKCNVLTGSAGEANNRRRREGDSGQNAEPTTPARTKPGPSAMALNKRCRRHVLPRRASCLRNRRSRSATPLLSAQAHV